MRKVKYRKGQCIGTKSGTTAAGIDVSDVVFPKPFVNHTGSTADTGINRNGRDRTVEGTGPALHAGVAVRECNLFPVRNKHLMRTDFQTSAAADAGGLIEFQRYNIFQIAKVFHTRNLPTTSNTMLTTRAPAIAGRPICISFFTPEREV